MARHAPHVFLTPRAPQYPQTLGINYPGHRQIVRLGKSFRIQDVFVLHLVGGKPWEPGDPGAGEYPLSHGAWHAIRRECGLPDDGY